jgi:hypothetical protein
VKCSEWFQSASNGRTLCNLDFLVSGSEHLENREGGAAIATVENKKPLEY